MIDIFLKYKGDTTSLLIFSGAFIIAILIAMCFHEYAHAKVAYLCGDDTAYLAGRMKLNPLAHVNWLGALCFLLVGFGWANPVPITPRKFKEYRKGIFLTGIAGVTANFIICFFSCGLSILFLKLYANTLEQVTFWTYVLYFLYVTFSLTTTVNLSLCLFNLLPFYPLDGFNVMQSLTKGTNKFVIFMKNYGNIILIALLLTTFFETGLGYAVNFILEPITAFWAKVIGVI